MFHHKGGQLRVQVAEQDEVAVTHLVEHTDGVTFAIGSALGGLHGRDVGDVAVVSNGVVVDEVAHLLNEAVVTHRDVAQRGIVDASMLAKALGHLDLLLEDAQADVAIEHDTVEAVGRKGLGHLYTIPTLGPTTIVLEHVNLLLSQMSVISHK